MATALISTSILSNAGRLGPQNSDVPPEFIWPEEDCPSPDSTEELPLPLIDLNAFRSGDPTVAQLVADACEQHGFFLVVNHGVDKVLLDNALRSLDALFALPLSEKQRAQRHLGESIGYSTSFLGRFSSNLPWKEIFTFRHAPAISPTLVRDYMVETLGEGVRRDGEVFEEYCYQMKRVCSEILEIIGVSLGIGRKEFVDFYEDSDSFLRLNYYPPCMKPKETLGTGPHCDPTSITILQQDGIAGLQVFTGGRWRTVSPHPDALVVNVGDTFMALSNGRCKSATHRAVVNSEVVRRSIAFFLSPAMEKVVRPPKGLVDADHPRVYPDFTWSEFLWFTMNPYRVDVTTLDAFSKWIQNGKGSEKSDCSSS